jgi:hypothetical protein
MEWFRIRLHGDVFNLLNRENFRGLNTVSHLAFGSIGAAKSGPERRAEIETAVLTLWSCIRESFGS